MKLSKLAGTIGAFGLLSLAACDCGDTETCLFDAGSRDAGPLGMDGGQRDAGAPDAGPAVDAGPCPDLRGRYDLSFTGTCGDLVMDAAEQRVDGRGECNVYFEVDGMGVASGPLDIMGDGSFTGVTMTLGSSDYTCNGTWDAAGEVIMLDCTGTLGMCDVTMMRTGPL